MRAINSTDSDYTTTNLLYYFWLPSGNDEFGIRERLTAPLSHIPSYRKGVEEPIADRWATKHREIRKRNNLTASVEISGDERPHEGDLGLRKIHQQIRFDPNRQNIPAFVADEPIDGSAIILSNGLYLWSFQIRHIVSIDTQSIRSFGEDLLRNQFVPLHIGRILGFGWPPDLNRRLDDYSGALTHYQLDILFNGLFDDAAHPAAFFGKDKPAYPQYRLEDIIHSISLFGMNTIYRPLWDIRKDYSMRGHYGADTKCHLDTNIDLQKVEPTPGPEADERERLLSRLTYSAMEQFLRVSIPFGVANYRGGAGPLSDGSGK